MFSVLIKYNLIVFRPLFITNFFPYSIRPTLHKQFIILKINQSEMVNINLICSAFNNEMPKL